ncbi:hypothetical protein FOA43_000509 [Brettanomyces nanus]|uniref:E3 ubiquitin protein ligase n=1 Tax=Eeniella nana TaxID=13502 RepID=A0A875RZ68_EENNA|nr:uncharacterized protein FOA43_000509 [Brettanomyces nanus]QPG73202.1 hypothetical protein FOA43_000509 [Brettanomyces nanus]
MSTVKRPFSENTTGQQSVKKKFKRSETSLEELTDGGLLSQDDVIYYQKEAIYRMLNLVRHRNRRLRRELSRINDNYSSLNKYYSIINNWWSQVIDNFQNFDMVAKVEASDGSDFNQHLLINVPESAVKETDQLQQELQAKRTKLISLLQPLLSQPVKNRDDKLVDLEESLTNLNVFKSRLEDENKLLRDKIEDLNQEVDTYVKFVENRSSKSLNRISDNLHDKEELKTEDKDGGVIKEEVTDVADGLSETVGVNGNGTAKVEEDLEALKASRKEVEDLKIELAGLTSENKAMSEQLDDKSGKAALLEKQVTELKGAMINISEKDLVRCSEYQALLAKNSSLSTQISQVKFEGSKIESQLFELESNFTAKKEKLEAQLKSEMEFNNGYIAKLENDINRIRSDRDSLKAKINIMKAEKGKSELAEEYRKLNQILEKRVEELEESMDTELNFENNSDKGNQDSETLSKHNKLLSRELKQMEDAFKSTRQLANTKLAKYIESDSYINKLSVEKSKADEKYFQAMRTKDALTMQNKILNGNLTKQAELIEVLKANEKKLLKKLEIENSLFSKLKNLESVYNNDLTFQRNKNKELEIKLKTLQDNNSDLQSSLVKKQEVISQKDKKVLSLDSHTQSMQSQVNELQKLVEKYRSDSRSAEDEEINQALLTMTKCQLCNKNFKDVTLKSCGHCFCSECIHNRLASRMRKCPNCNKQFSNYDLLSIHL